MRLHEQIAQGLRTPQPQGEAEALTGLLAELTEDPRWKALEQKTLAVLAGIVRDLIDNAGDVAKASRLAGKADALLDLLSGPRQAAAKVQQPERNGEA